jgi:Uncharacterized conserved protein
MPLENYFPDEYHLWLIEIKEKIRNSQLKAALKINAEMLTLYWELGKAITEKQQKASWGDRIITQLSRDLSHEFTNIKGFSVTNLKYFRKWYQFYKGIAINGDSQCVTFGQGGEDQIGQHCVDQLDDASDSSFPPQLGTIPWGHHIQIISKCKSVEEALFYICQTAANNWKRSVLIHQIETNYYDRKGKSQNNFDLILPKPQSELASELINNPIYLDFLHLGDETSERELENAILRNIKKFLLELGTGFSFYGQQYHIKVSEKDFYIDLLFYHTKLHCYFVVELKVTEFEPEHAGKLEFYINVVDEQMKTPEDNPTIGLLLCRTADKVIVEYTQKTKMKPIGVTEFKHTIPKEWQNELPDVESLRYELQKEVKVNKKPVDEKLEKLKGLVQKMNFAKADLDKDIEITRRLFEHVIIPLARTIDTKLDKIKPYFNRLINKMVINHKAPYYDIRNPDIKALFESAEDIWVAVLDFELEGFNRAGVKVFNVWDKLHILLGKNTYSIGPNDDQVWDEKVYRNMHNAVEIENIADRMLERFLEKINDRAEQIVQNQNG